MEDLKRCFKSAENRLCYSLRYVKIELRILESGRQILIFSTGGLSHRFFEGSLIDFLVGGRAFIMFCKNNQRLIFLRWVSTIGFLEGWEGAY